MDTPKAICRICNIEKDLETGFYKRTETTYYTDCKQCRNRRRYPDAHTRQRGFYLQPKEKQDDILKMLYDKVKVDPSITYKQIASKHVVPYFTFMYWIRNKRMPLV